MLIVILLVIFAGKYLLPANKQERRLSEIILQYDTLAETSPDDAIQLLDSTYRSSGTKNIDDLVGYYARKYKFYYDAKKDFKKAYLYVDSAVQLLQENRADKKRVEMYIDILNDKAYLLRKENNYEAALKYYLLANKIYQKEISDTCLAFGTPSALGDLFLSIKNNKRAINYYLEDYRHQQACDDKQFLRFFFKEKILLSVGICYTNLEMYDSAYYYFDRALQFVRTKQHEYDLSQQPNFPDVAEAAINGFLANIAAIRGQVAKAEEMFNKSMAITGTADLDYYSTELTNLAEMYLREKQLFNALRTINRLDSLSVKYVMPETRMQYFRLMASLSNMKHDYEGCLRHAEAYEKITDSLNAPIKKFRYQDVQREFAIHQQIGLNETLQEHNKFKSNLILPGVVAMMLLITMVLLIRKGILKRRKQASSLKKLNELLAGKNDELEIAALNLHQVMKNNKRIMNIMAHDLRSPLAGMQLLLRSMEKRKQTSVSGHIVIGMGLICQYTLGILKILLKKEDKEDLLSQMPVTLSDVFTDVLNEQMQKVKERNLTVKILPGDLDVIDNPSKLKLLLSCYITYMVEATVPGDCITIVVRQYKEKNILLFVKGCLPEAEKGKNAANYKSRHTNDDHLFSVAYKTLYDGKDGELLADSFGYGCLIPVKLPHVFLHLYICL